MKSQPLELLLGLGTLFFLSLLILYGEMLIIMLQKRRMALRQTAGQGPLHEAVLTAQGPDA